MRTDNSFIYRIQLLLYVPIFSGVVGKPYFIILAAAMECAVLHVVLSCAFFCVSVVRRASNHPM